MLCSVWIPKIFYEFNDFYFAILSYESIELLKKIKLLSYYIPHFFRRRQRTENIICLPYSKQKLISTTDAFNVIQKKCLE